VLAAELLQASTTEAYYNAHVEMNKFIQSVEESNTQLHDWLKWWHNRRFNIFRAFTGQDCPRSNLAEVVHASWTNRDESGLSLYQAAEFDTKDSLIIEAELLEIENTTRGKGLYVYYKLFQSRIG